MCSMTEPTEPEPHRPRRTRIVFHVPTALAERIDQRAREHGRTRTSELVRALTWAYQQLESQGGDSNQT
jgi:metal-responsive CopG/Arc/MetJ family transcriptional regulator